MFKRQIITVLIVFILTIVTFSGCTQKESNDDTIISDESNDEDNTQDKESIQTILSKTETIQSMYYELDASIFMSEFGTQTAMIKIWQKKPNIKEQITSVTEGIKSEIIVIYRPEGIYIYDNENNSYRILTEDFVSITSSLQYFDGDIIKNYLDAQTSEKFETEIIDGKKATIIEYSPEDGEYPMEIKLWIWNEKGLPLKAFIDMDLMDISMTMEFIFSNYSFSVIPDSLFDIS